MAQTTNKEKEYVQKAITTSIKFTSRASVKIRENFYTVEACEERMLPDVAGIDLEKEKELLWDSVNVECDNQIQAILQSFRR